MIRVLFGQLLLLAVMTTLLPPAIRADFPRILFHAPDTTAEQQAHSIKVPLRLTNYQDTVAGLEFVIKSSNPELVWFDFANGGIDWNGSLMAGWEWLSAQPLNGDSGTIWFRGIANANPYDGVNTPGIPPQQQGVLVNLLINTGLIAFPPIEVGSFMYVQPPYGFSDPSGHGIGVHTDTIEVYDTTYYLCTQWLPEIEVCASWAEVDPDTSAYDSVLIAVDSSLYGYIDTSLVVLYDGQIRLNDCRNGDLTDDGVTDVADITELIICLFINFTDCTSLARCDFDLSGVTDVTDLTYMISYLYLSGPPPPCL